MLHRTITSHLAIFSLGLVGYIPSSMASWPQFRGQNRDGVATDTPPLVHNLPKSGLTEQWSQPLGDGFAGPVISQNRTVIFHRVGDQATIDCFDAKTGAAKWSHRYKTNYRDDFGFDPGPRSSPTISTATVFAYGPEGVLSAIGLETGKERWQIDLASKYRAPKGFFGRAGAPLVSAGNVLLNIGGTKGDQPAGIVAFETKTGIEAWHATTHEASYSSPIATAIGGRQTALFFTRDGLLGINPNSGTQLFEKPYRPSNNASVNAASPVMCSPDTVFISTCYGVGASLWKLTPGKQPTLIWKKEDVLDAHYSTPVLVDGRLYGFHGRQETGTELRCIDPNNAKVFWSSTELPCGQLIAAGSDLIILTEDGELAMVSATPDAFKLRWRAQLLRRGVRGIPALSAGRLYARGPKRLVCIDLRK